jgi:predicted GH43/DUF377 family glycosyl hydrolase
MSESDSDCVVLETTALLPEAWRGLAEQGPVRAFNPGLLSEENGWTLAYRVVGSDGRRRIAACRLDRSLQIIAGSAVALTDFVRFRSDVVYPQVVTEWFADPRLYRFGGRVYVYWNSGWHEPRNWQFLQELDPRTLQPIGCPREMVLRGERQKLEKNWTCFSAADGRTYAVYSITPHRVLEFSLAGDGDIEFEEISNTAWTPNGYPICHGGLRGGAPPVHDGTEFWSFCHSVHDGPDGYRYLGAAYRFDTRKPFAPTAGPVRPLDIAENAKRHRVYPRLNPAVGEVIYPCGAARDGARWLISHGINDERCAISLISHAALEASMALRGSAL